MTDTPSNVNKLGLLAHLNIRIPLSDYFAVNGIIQYRYIGGTTLGPYYNEASDDYPSTTITTNAQIFPPTELSYNHLFVGLGIGINFKKR